jgi:hypothetical protein
VSRAAIGLAAALVITVAGVAEAQTDDELARARAHYEAGRALYGLGNFSDALREFAAGYQLAHRPQFLIDIAHAYRRLAEPLKAREMCERFLAEATPDDPQRPAVGKLIEELDRELARARSSTAIPAEAAAAVRAPPPPSAVAAPALDAPARPQPVAATPSVASNHGESPSRFRRYWWIIPLVGAVLAAAAVGLYFGLRSSNQFDCGSVQLGCFDASGLR